MKAKGLKLKAGQVDEWLDCGNKDATVYTNKRVLELKYPNNHIAKTATLTNSVVIPPCFIGENVLLENAVVGPFVSVGNNSTINSSIVRNSIVRENSHIQDAGIDNSLIGNYVQYRQQLRDLSMGDYTTEL
jgi:glucose-1-phosphate thymidylyltransferase